MGLLTAGGLRLEELDIKSAQLAGIGIIWYDFKVRQTPLRRILIVMKGTDCGQY